MCWARAALGVNCADPFGAPRTSSGDTSLLLVYAISRPRGGSRWPVSRACRASTVSPGLSRDAWSCAVTLGLRLAVFVRPEGGRRVALLTSRPIVLQVRPGSMPAASSFDERPELHLEVIGESYPDDPERIGD